MKLYVIPIDTGVNCTYMTDRPSRGGNLSSALTTTWSAQAMASAASTTKATIRAQQMLVNGCSPMRFDLDDAHVVLPPA